MSLVIQSKVSVLLCIEPMGFEGTMEAEGVALEGSVEAQPTLYFLIYYFLLSLS